jgi:UDP-glucose 6-dehydrogenase
MLPRLFDESTRSSRKWAIRSFVSGAKTLSFADPLKAVREADALVLATEWSEFREADFAVLKELMRSDHFRWP